MRHVHVALEHQEVMGNDAVAAIASKTHLPKLGADLVTALSGL